MIELVSVGDYIAEGLYEVHSRFDRVVNYISERGMISLVCPEIGAGPINVVIEGDFWKHSDSIKLDANYLLIDKVQIAIDQAKRFDSTIDIAGDINMNLFYDSFNYFNAQLEKLSPLKSLAFLLDEKRISDFKSGFEIQLVERFQQGVGMLMDSAAVPGAKMLRGLGFGLTPSGDDFLAGFLAGFNLRQKMEQPVNQNEMDDIFCVSLGDNPISNAFLTCARNGRYFESTKLLIESMLAGEKAEIEKQTRKMLSIGETSGADWGIGFLKAFEKKR
jgi:hypothetical protein